MLAYLSRGSFPDSLQEGFTENQLQAYVAWVNGQLKKRPAVRPVQDLRQDLRNGVVLACLVEIVAGEKLSGIQASPSSQQEMRANVDKVLQFVASRKIRMHQTSAKDIVDGNLKSIMRLVLALAAHFKPSSGQGPVRGPAPQPGYRPPCAAAVAQTAAAALAEVCHDVSRSGREVFRFRRRSSSLDEEIENPCWSVRALVQQYEGQQGVPPEGSTPSSLTSSSPLHGVKSESASPRAEERASFVIVPCEAAENRTDEADAPFSRDWHVGSSGTWEEQLLEQQDHLEKEMEEAKSLISGLQALLLHGSLPEDDQEKSLAIADHGANPEEQLVIIRSRLDLSTEENQGLKKELLKCKQEARTLQGIKDALQQRLAQQDTSVLQLKQELLRTSMDRDELQNQNVDLQRKVDERDRLLGEVKRDLGQRDRCLQQHQARLDHLQRKLAQANTQQVELKRELEHKDALLSRSIKRAPDEVARSPDLGFRSNGLPAPSTAAAAHGVPPPLRQRGDLRLVRDALRSLRDSFGGHDPQHHTIDSLEQGISSLVERLHLAEMLPIRPERRVRGKSPGRAAGESRESRPPCPDLPPELSSPANGSGTKVLYFTDHSLTPFTVNIPKRLGEVTLRDFRTAIDRGRNLRYHFKALDPEFGTVKEEVFHDNDLIPGWEGKIVAWVEEDHGEN
ncbi:dixin isoform X1 [Tachyglossus aculeatus]|uniref:dixin isoform X1 n=1 Tax=Tachyglossus aculeatus TaxID=9261 RepID=UPI0018F77E8A|nr:dixin isoform X1 [Tachyglossus aculeatus]